MALAKVDRAKKERSQSLTLLDAEGTSLAQLFGYMGLVDDRLALQTKETINST